MVVTEVDFSLRWSGNNEDTRADGYAAESERGILANHRFAEG